MLIFTRTYIKSVDVSEYFIGPSSRVKQLFLECLTLEGGTERFFPKRQQLTFN